MKIQIEHEGYQPRIGGILLLQCAAIGLFVLFVLRFWYLQIHKGEDFYRQAQVNRMRQERVYATRGTIRDRNNAVLAENRTAFGLFLMRDDCRDIPSTLTQVSEWTGTPIERLQSKLQTDRTRVNPSEPILLISDLPFNTVAKIEARLMHWPGLQIITQPKRAYPYGEIFTHILGYVAEANDAELDADKYLSIGDTIGKQGLEFMLEQQLRGYKGMSVVDVDVLGRVLGRTIEEKPQHGENISLNIDVDLQSAIASYMEDKTGNVIVLEPDTGNVLSLVTTPAYDNNIFIGGLSKKKWDEIRNDPRHPLLHRGIQSVYPPGSVWKLMMGGLILESNISPKQRVTCTGAVSVGDHTFRCWRGGGHGSVDLMQALVDSCDVYFYTMGERLGIDRIEPFARDCGFGKLTGIDLPNEKTGLVPSRAWKEQRHSERWQRGETLNVAIGQGYTLTTPMQLATFTGALLNGGKLLKPQLIAGQDPEVIGQLPMSVQTINFILESMRRTVDSGTARVLKRDDAVVGGKTGTAQVVKLRMIGERRLRADEVSYFERDHAWMASWAERGGKRVVVITMIEHGGGGASVAGPVTKKVYDFIYGSRNEHTAERIPFGSVQSVQ
jgi:penicillin-binding protein 2